MSRYSSDLITTAHTIVHTMPALQGGTVTATILPGATELELGVFGKGTKATVRLKKEQVQALGDLLGYKISMQYQPVEEVVEAAATVGLHIKPITDLQVPVLENGYDIAKRLDAEAQPAF